MASMTNEVFKFKGILFLMLLTIPSEATNLDCNGKAFHCVNSTHFMICVDLGRGVSTTIDDFVIPCPMTTVCKATNRFECEFPAPSVTPPEVSTIATTETLSDVTVFNSKATSIPFEEYFNTVSTTTLTQSDVQSFSTDSLLSVESITAGDITKTLQSVKPIEHEVSLSISSNVNAGTKTDISLINIVKPNNQVNSSNSQDNNNLDLNVIPSVNNTTESTKNINVSQIIHLPIKDTKYHLVNDSLTDFNSVTNQTIHTEELLTKGDPKATVEASTTEYTITTEVSLPSITDKNVDNNRIKIPYVVSTARSEVNDQQKLSQGNKFHSNVTESSIQNEVFLNNLKTMKPTNNFKVHEIVNTSKTDIEITLPYEVTSVVTEAYNVSETITPANNVITQEINFDVSTTSYREDSYKSAITTEHIPGYYSSVQDSVMISVPPTKVDDIVNIPKTKTERTIPHEETNVINDVNNQNLSTKMDTLETHVTESSIPSTVYSDSETITLANVHNNIDVQNATNHQDSQNSATTTAYIPGYHYPTGSVQDSVVISVPPTKVENIVNAPKTETERTIPHEETTVTSNINNQEVSTKMNTLDTHVTESSILSTVYNDSETITLANDAITQSPNIDVQNTTNMISVPPTKVENIVNTPKTKTERTVAREETIVISNINNQEVSTKMNTLDTHVKESSILSSVYNDSETITLANDVITQSTNIDVQNTTNHADSQNNATTTAYMSGYLYPTAFVQDSVLTRGSPKKVEDIVNTLKIETEKTIPHEETTVISNINNQEVATKMNKLNTHVTESSILNTVYNGSETETLENDVITQSPNIDVQNTTNMITIPPTKVENIVNTPKTKTERTIAREETTVISNINNQEVSTKMNTLDTRVKESSILSTVYNDTETITLANDVITRSTNIDVQNTTNYADSQNNATTTAYMSGYLYPTAFVQDSVMTRGPPIKVEDIVNTPKIETERTIPHEETTVISNIDNQEVATKINTLDTHVTESSIFSTVYNDSETITLENDVISQSTNIDVQNTTNYADSQNNATTTAYNNMSGYLYPNASVHVSVMTSGPPTKVADIINTLKTKTERMIPHEKTTVINDFNNKKLSTKMNTLDTHVTESSIISTIYNDSETITLANDVITQSTNTNVQNTSNHQDSQNSTTTTAYIPVYRIPTASVQDFVMTSGPPTKVEDIVNTPKIKTERTIPHEETTVISNVNHQEISSKVNTLDTYVTESLVPSTVYNDSEMITLANNIITESTNIDVQKTTNHQDSQNSATTTAYIPGYHNPTASVLDSVMTSGSPTKAEDIVNTPKTETERTIPHEETTIISNINNQELSTKMNTLDTHVTESSILSTVYNDSEIITLANDVITQSTNIDVQNTINHQDSQNNATTTAYMSGYFYPSAFVQDSVMTTGSFKEVNSILNTSKIKNKTIHPHEVKTVIGEVYNEEVSTKINKLYTYTTETSILSTMYNNFGTITPDNNGLTNKITTDTTANTYHIEPYKSTTFSSNTITYNDFEEVSVTNNLSIIPTDAIPAMNRESLSSNKVTVDVALDTPVLITMNITVPNMNTTASPTTDLVQIDFNSTSDDLKKLPQPAASLVTASNSATETVMNIATSNLELLTDLRTTVTTANINNNTQSDVENIDYDRNSLIGNTIDRFVQNEKVISSNYEHDTASIPTEIYDANDGNSTVNKYQPSYSEQIHKLSAYIPSIPELSITTMVSIDNTKVPTVNDDSLYKTNLQTKTKNQIVEVALPTSSPVINIDRETLTDENTQTSLGSENVFNSTEQQNETTNIPVSAVAIDTTNVSDTYRLSTMKTHTEKSISSMDYNNIDVNTGKIQMPQSEISIPTNLSNSETITSHLITAISQLDKVHTNFATTTVADVPATSTSTIVEQVRNPNKDGIIHVNVDLSGNAQRDYSQIPANRNTNATKNLSYTNYTIVETVNNTTLNAESPVHTTISTKTLEMINKPSSKTQNFTQVTLTGSYGEQEKESHVTAQLPTPINTYSESITENILINNNVDSVLYLANRSQTYIDMTITKSPFIAAVDSKTSEIMNQQIAQDNLNLNIQRNVTPTSDFQIIKDTTMSVPKTSRSKLIEEPRGTAKPNLDIEIQFMIDSPESQLNQTEVVSKQISETRSKNIYQNNDTLNDTHLLGYTVNNSLNVYERQITQHNPLENTSVIQPETKKSVDIDLSNSKKKSVRIDIQSGYSIANNTKTHGVKIIDSSTFAVERTLDERFTSSSTVNSNQNSHNLQNNSTHETLKTTVKPIDVYNKTSEDILHFISSTGPGTYLTNDVIKIVTERSREYTKGSRKKETGFEDITVATSILGLNDAWKGDENTYANSNKRERSKDMGSEMISTPAVQLPRVNNNDGNAESIKQENLQTFHTLPDSGGATDVITGPPIVNNKTHTEITHAGITSLLAEPPTNPKSTDKNENKENDVNKRLQQKEQPNAPKNVSLYSETISAKNENNERNGLSQPDEMLVVSENNNSKSTIKGIDNVEYNISTINKNSDKKIGDRIDNKKTLTNEMIETISSTNGHKSNKRTADAHNNTVITNVQKSTSRYSSQTKSKTESNTQTNGFPEFKSVTSKPKSNKFTCNPKLRGRYADELDCRRFYICLGNGHVIQGTCPINTVFSEIRKQCTNNLSHCIRNNQFRCVTEGHFSDFLNDNIYYICVKKNVSSFIRFKLQCQNGYHLNKTSVRCVLNKNAEQSTSSSKSDSSKYNSDQSVSSAKLEDKDKTKRFKCKKEGIFVDPSNCKRYFECRKTDNGYRQKRKRCDSEEIFHKDKKKCVESESNEC